MDVAAVVALRRTEEGNQQGTWELTGGGRWWLPAGQVSGPRFSDEEFLAEAVSNYRRFVRLKLRLAHREQVIVPTYQIDLMWHTHILANFAGAPPAAARRPPPGYRPAIHCRRCAPLMAAGAVRRRCCGGAAPAGYNADCIRLTGATLNHDDSLNDRSDDSPLGECGGGPVAVTLAATPTAWQRCHGGIGAPGGGGGGGGGET